MQAKVTTQNLILDFIVENGGCKEYQLISFINESCAEFFAPLKDSPSLFKKHFFLFNYLYNLNDQLLAKGQRLTISALDIRLVPVTNPRQELGHPDALCDFYLNEDNLNLSEQEVEKMMNGFWQKYLALDKKSESLKILGLEGEQNLTVLMLKRRYNELARRHHPDKGGNNAQFIVIKDAYRDLKSLF